MERVLAVVTRIRRAREGQQQRLSRCANQEAAHGLTSELPRGRGPTAGTPCPTSCARCCAARLRSQGSSRHRAMIVKRCAGTRREKLHASDQMVASRAAASGMCVPSPASVSPSRPSAPAAPLALHRPHLYGPAASVQHPKRRPRWHLGPAGCMAAARGGDPPHAPPEWLVPTCVEAVGAGRRLPCFRHACSRLCTV